MNHSKSFKSGYASIIGRPNVGKSTLLNRLVAQKVAATSSRPQTTRNKITGVVHLPEAQIILVDTPGIHSTKKTLNDLKLTDNDKQPIQNNKTTINKQKQPKTFQNTS